MHGISRYRLVITPLFFSSAIPESVHIADSQSFLFTLVNPSGTEPMKVVLKPGVSGGMRYRADWGPRFGSKVSSDLWVWPTDNYGVFSQAKAPLTLTNWKCLKSAYSKTHLYKL